jgi:hypothetical protein
MLWATLHHHGLLLTRKQHVLSRDFQAHYNQAGSCKRAPDYFPPLPVSLAIFEPVPLPLAALV